MDSMVIRLDPCEPSGPWRHIMHDGDAGSGNVAAATVRLSQTFLTQELGGKAQHKGSALTLKAKSLDVNRTPPASLGVDVREVPRGSSDSPLWYPPSTAAPKFESSDEPPKTPAAAVVSPGAAVKPPPTPPTTPAASLLALSPKMAAGARTKPDERGCVFSAHTQYLPIKLTSASTGWSSRASLKRARPLSDVDGPYTSNQGCKKRRLLRHLVTSRLSQRFSIPATHVPNLEGTIGMTGGGGMEKRFLRLAAVAAARRIAASPTPSAGAQLQLRQQPHSTPPSEVLRRAAIINRFRMRVFVQPAEHGDAAVAEMAASAALLRFSPGVHVALGGSGLARFPRSSASGQSQEGILTPPPPRPNLPAPTLSQSMPRRAPFLNNTDGPIQVVKQTSVATSPRDPSPYQARQALAPPTPFALPAATAAAGPLSRVAAIARCRSISPGMTPPGSPSKGLRPADTSPRMVAAGRLLPVSPRLQPLSSSDDDEGVAFPTSEHESRYESGDDSDDVYTDFSVMFGGGGGGGAEDDDGMSGSEIDGYEEFMDDLDGIPWSAR
ncbi:hypothetical protein RB595_008383 [Gaeumannomyces hyphopodioides]